LQATGCGFPWLALQAMASRTLASEGGGVVIGGTPHLPPKAKRIIFIFMQGGPSHVDSFDYKPAIEKRDGESIPFDDARVLANSGRRGDSHRVMKSPWAFRQYGEGGHWVSDLFPNVARHSDKLCMIHSMHTEGVAHGPATLFLHCGATNSIRPSFGSWVHYGLGTENDNLPGFVTIGPPMGNGGTRNFGSAFLPAVHQGTPVGKVDGDGSDLMLRNAQLAADELPATRRRLDFVQGLNRQRFEDRPGDTELDAMIRSYDLAWRMQTQAPETFDLSGETEETKKLYGIGQQPTDPFGRRCLLARRLCESGVRFIQVNYGDNSANPAWDQHSNLPKHADHAANVDLPIAGLLEDLDRRGLLEETLVWWGGEFGRTPYAQANGTGRDHNPLGFTVWLAGAGVRPGFHYGATDEFGHKAITDRVHMHDLHATLLHLLGLDHEKLTFRHAGRDYRLTDVYGKVVHDIIT
jgi:hypothetical protein